MQSVFASLLQQICSYHVPLPTYLIRRWGEKKALLRVDEAVTDFLSLVPRFSEVFVLIDGLDECSNAGDLVGPLGRLAASPCRLFLASRQILRGLSTLRGAVGISIDSANGEDTKLYLHRCRDRLPVLAKNMPEDDADEMIAKVNRHSKGRFVAHSPLKGSAHSISGCPCLNANTCVCLASCSPPV